MADLLFRKITDEWAVVSTSLWARRRLAAWAETDDRFAGCRSPAEVVAAMRHGDDRSRELSWAVLRLVANDELAHQVVLHAVMPALLAQLRQLIVPARSSKRSSLGSIGGDGDQVVLAAAARAICEQAGSTSKWPLQDVTRRTKRLVVQQLRQDERWMDHHTIADAVDEMVTAEPAAPPERELSAAEELAQVLGEAVELGSISEVESQMILQTRAVGYQVAEVAELFGHNVGSFTKRRSRAERRVVEILSATKAVG